MTHLRTRLALALLTLVPIGMAPALADPAAGGPRTLTVPGHGDLEAVTVPDLSPFEPAVGRQLESAVAAADEVLASADSDRALGEAFGELGKLFHAYELLDAARQAYRNAARLAPKEPLWPYYLGHAARQAGELDDAIAAWNQALTRAGRGDPTVFTHLGRAYQARGDLAKATELLEAVLASDGDLAAAKASLGEIALEQGDAARAIVLLEAALAAVPAANRLHYPLALAYRKAGQPDRAREHLAQRGKVGLGVEDPRLAALEALKSGERVHLLRGRQAFAAGRFVEAAEAFQKAAEADPSSARSRVNLGTALARLGENDAAIASFRQALAIDDRNPIAHLNLGQLLLAQGDEAGLGHLERAAEEGPADAVNHRVLADALRVAGRPEEALESFHQATVWAPTDAAAIFGKAIVLVDLARYEEARAWLTEANRRMPSDGRIAAALARLLAACPDIAMRDGNRALELARTIFAATERGEHARLVALSLAELGRCEEAAALQRQIVLALPNDDPRHSAFAAELTAYSAGPPCRP